MDKLPSIFTTQDAIKHGTSKQQLKKMLIAGTIFRIRRGIYCTTRPNQVAYTKFITTTKKVGPPSAICLRSALEYYHLAEHEDTVWLMAPFEKRCSIQNIHLLRRRNPRWTIGIDQRDGFCITNLERTLVEVLSYPTKIDKKDAVYALKLAIKQRKTDLHKIIHMASRLKLIKRITPIIEILLF